MKNATLIATVSAVSDKTSAGFQLADLSLFSLAVIFTGSDLVGTLTLECTDDETGAANYVTVASSSTAVAASGNVTYNVNGAGYRWVRVKWVYTSGAGNITATITVKQPVQA